MDGDEILRAQEEIDVLGREAVLLGAEVDAVEDQVQIVAVRLDLRMVRFFERVFDRQIVELEHVGQDARLLRRRAAQIDPDPDAAVGEEPGWVDPIDDRGRPALIPVDRDQSPTLAVSAACAAASRATGTRYGEQLT